MSVQESFLKSITFQTPLDDLINPLNEVYLPSIQKSEYKEIFIKIFDSIKCLNSKLNSASSRLSKTIHCDIYSKIMGEINEKIENTISGFLLGKNVGMEKDFTFNEFNEQELERESRKGISSLLESSVSHKGITEVLDPSQINFIQKMNSFSDLLGDLTILSRNEFNTEIEIKSKINSINSYLSSKLDVDKYNVLVMDVEKRILEDFKSKTDIINKNFLALQDNFSQTKSTLQKEYEELNFKVQGKIKDCLNSLNMKIDEEYIQNLSASIQTGLTHFIQSKLSTVRQDLQNQIDYVKQDFSQKNTQISDISVNIQKELGVIKVRAEENPTNKDIRNINEQISKLQKEVNCEMKSLIRLQNRLEMQFCDLLKTTKTLQLVQTTKNSFVDQTRKDEIDIKEKK